MADVLVTENIAGREMDALRQSLAVTFEPGLFRSPQRLREALTGGGYRAWIVRNQTRVTADLIAAAGDRLEVIARAGVGLDNVDVRAASDAGIVVVWAPEQNSVSVAELTVGLMISLARMIPQADRGTRAGGWERNRFTGVELQGKTLGIVGLGRIGFLTAMRARAFGMNILAYDAFINPDSFTVGESRARLVPHLGELLEASDFVSCHAPETPQTINLFNEQAFARMKPSAYFINTSRGRIVNEQDLALALREKRIAGAALDVRASEPPGATAFDDLDNVILTPHIAAFTREGQERVVACVCRDVAAVLSGGNARNYFNFPAPRRRARAL